MIVFDLKCEHGHTFEAWFQSADDMQKQRRRGLIACPACDATVIETALTPPNVGRKGNQAAPRPVAMDSDLSDAPSGAENNEVPEAVKAAIESIKDHITQNCEYVGSRFPEEARKVHYGEREKTGIWGEATPAETAELKDEGIDVVAVPFLKKPVTPDA